MFTVCHTNTGEWADVLRESLRAMYLACGLDPETWVADSEDGDEDELKENDVPVRTSTPQSSLQSVNTSLISPLPKTPLRDTQAKTLDRRDIYKKKRPLTSPQKFTPLARKKAKRNITKPDRFKL